MAVPDFQRIMLPLLKIAGDGQEHRQGEVRDTLGLQFGLTDEERKEPLPSGRQAKFDNRVAWSVVYLRKAGLLENTRRGVFRITDKGIALLKSNPAKIDIRLLLKYPEFQAFRDASRQTKEDNGDIEKNDRTPEEILEASYLDLRQKLAQELLDRIMGCSPKFFERLVIDLLVKMGYGGSRKDAGEAVGKSGDDGIDGIIKEDKLGLDVVYVQAKKWDGSVGRPTVQAFAGSLDGQRARKGVLITTSHFSQDAKEYVTRIEKKIILIDGEQLAQLMIDHGIGVADVASYMIKRVDLDYFDEEQ